MLLLTKYAFPKAPIQAFEITHSYCPGTYDLSIHGKKICRYRSASDQKWDFCYDVLKCQR